METQGLAARQRVALAFGALVMLVVASMFQCGSLALAASAREVLVALADVLALLCAALLIEDAAARPVREALVRMGTRLRAC
jgi:hypothetical protein